ncbi:MAG: TraR/DksA C4-type zinc finger protein [Saprospiraceae bacterium]|nr:TraR/DksA C4-type zinc finger protein [Saprospiraceae bacterium]
MNAEEKASFKERLIDLIKKQEEEIAMLESMTAPISPENSIGRVSRMDAIQNKGISEASLRNKREKLSKLKISLSKVDKPDFGTCSRCERPIQIARLMYMPESSRCLHCADKA